MLHSFFWMWSVSPAHSLNQTAWMPSGPGAFRLLGDLWPSSTLLWVAFRLHVSGSLSHFSPKYHIYSGTHKEFFCQDCVVAGELPSHIYPSKMRAATLLMKALGPFFLTQSAAWFLAALLSTLFILGALTCTICLALSTCALKAPGVKLVRPCTTRLCVYWRSSSWTNLRSSGRE